MKSLLISVVIALAASSAAAQDAPEFFSETYPSHALGPAMEWYGSLKNEDAALDAKTRELVALAVAA